VILRRFRSDEVGTFGTLEIDDIVFFTVEKPWKDNKPFESCIPEGEYSLVPHQSNKYGNVLAIVGGTVSHFKGEDFKRYACLIHTANYPHDVEGCTGLGDNYNQAANMVMNAKQSIIDFYNIVSPLEIHDLKIENADYIRE